MRVSASSAISAAMTKSVGRLSSTPFSAAFEHLLGGLDPLGLDDRVAHLDALGNQERERHPAADEQGVHAVDQPVDDAELVGDLRAAEDRHERPLRLGEHAGKRLDLAGQQ
jgi:hypothetical protein